MQHIFKKIKNISQVEDEVDDINKLEFEKLEKSLEEKAGKSPETWWKFFEMIFDCVDFGGIPLYIL